MTDELIATRARIREELTILLYSDYKTDQGVELKCYNCECGLVGYYNTVYDAKYRLTGKFPRFKNKNALALHQLLMHTEMASGFRDKPACPEAHSG